MNNILSKYAHLLAPGIRFVALNQPQWGRLHTALYRYLPYRLTRVYLGTMALARYLQVERPGILVATSNRVHLTAGIAWQIAGRMMPLVLRATNFPSGNLNLWTPLLGLVDFYLGGLARLTIVPATAVVAVADGVADEIARLSGLPRARIWTVFEPVLDQSMLEKSLAPLSHPWLEPGQPPVLLAVGHLPIQKDFPTLIKAFALARARRPMRLVLLGEGNQRQRLQKLIASLGVEADVCLFGHTDNPFAWMARSSMFVLSSAWVGLPAVLIEALARGCPVVSTNCPSGPSEILDHGKHGKLVPCRNPPSLVQAILETLDTEVDRSALRERARAFSAESSVDSYVTIFGVAMSSSTMMSKMPPPLARHAMTDAANAPPLTWQQCLKKARRKRVKKFGTKLIRSLGNFLGRQSLVGDTPVLNSKHFPFLKTFASDWQAIKAEVTEILKHRDAIPVFHDISSDQKRISKGNNWRTFILFGFGEKSEKNCKQAPATTRLLEAVPNLQTAWFSILAPGYHIPAHRGVSKGILRAHLGLIIPQEAEKCRMRIGVTINVWHAGEIFVFDDTYEHEVWNDTTEERVILHFDFDRPMRIWDRLVNSTFVRLLKLTAYYQEPKKIWLLLKIASRPPPAAPMRIWKSCPTPIRYSHSLHP